MEEWVNFDVVSLLPWSLDDDVHKRPMTPNVVWSNGNLFSPWSRVTMTPEFAGHCFLLPVWSVPCGFYSSMLYGGFLRSQMVFFWKGRQQSYLRRYGFLWCILFLVQCWCTNENSICNASYVLCTISGEYIHWNHYSVGWTGKYLFNEVKSERIV